MARPQEGEFAVFYKNYIDGIKGNSIQEIIDIYSGKFIKAINDIPIGKADYAYAEGKWTVKELLQHIIDSERVFTYRMLRLSRKDAYNFPGFDENKFSANAHATLRTLADLQEEFTLTRKSTDLFLRSLTEEDLLQKGTANNYEMVVNSLAFIIFGHVQHHINMLNEKYLNK